MRKWQTCILDQVLTMTACFWPSWCHIYWWENIVICWQSHEVFIMFRWKL